MRIWLDERRFEPSSFSCHDSGIGVLVRVDFKIAGEADAFAARFTGSAGEARAAQDLVSGLSPHRIIG